MRKLSTVTVYSIAMGYVEAAVVIYLREMLFANAQQLFPLRTLDPKYAIVEIVREGMTIVMLAMVAVLAGKNKFDRSMYFIYAFAIWDIFYYVVLKAAVGWPPSFTTFDVLFLIPVMWVGPVIAPLLIAGLLAFASAALLSLHGRLPDLRMRKLDILIFVIGCAVVLYSFTAGVFHILYISGPKGLENYTPKTYDWLLFSVGYLTMSAAVFRILSDSSHKMRSGIPGTTGEEPNEVNG